MKRIQIATCDFPEDVRRIQEILAKHGYEATGEECEKLWMAYSDLMAACWMQLPETDQYVFDCIERFILN